METDSWIQLANSSQSVWDHQMATLGTKAVIIGGNYIAVEPEDWRMDEDHKRNTVQTFNLPPYGPYHPPNTWSCCVPQMNFKRSRFSAVSVP